MRKFCISLLLLFAISTPAYAECAYVILEVTTVTVTDDQGNVLSSDDRYYFGWLCWSAGGGGGTWTIPSGGGGTTDPTPPPPPPPPPVDCFNACEASCWAEYFNATAGVWTPDEFSGGATYYQCGVLCLELARINRDNCFADCIIRCS